MIKGSVFLSDTIWYYGKLNSRPDRSVKSTKLISQSFLSSQTSPILTNLNLIEQAQPIIFLRKIVQCNFSVIWVKVGWDVEQFCILYFWEQQTHPKLKSKLQLRESCRGPRPCMVAGGDDTSQRLFRWVIVIYFEVLQYLEPALHFHVNMYSLNLSRKLLQKLTPP